MKRIYLFLIFILPFQIIAQNKTYYHLFLLDPELSKRMSISYSYQDNLENKDANNLPVKKQTLRVAYEHPFFSFYSLSLGIPYTFLESEGSNKRNFLDHIHILNKFYKSYKQFDFYGGLSIDLPRNHDNAGDVPSNVGYLEPYLGIGYRFYRLHTKLTIDWNTQYNSKFKEEKNQEFVRKWLFNYSLGYIFESFPLQIWLESQYQKIYDPSTLKNEYWIYGISFSYHFSFYSVSISYINFPKEYAYRKNISLWFEKFF